MVTTLPLQCFVCGKPIWSYGLRVDPREHTGVPVRWDEANPLEPLVCSAVKSLKCYRTALNDPAAWEAMEKMRLVASRKYLTS